MAAVETTQTEQWVWSPTLAAMGSDTPPVRFEIVDPASGYAVWAVTQYFDELDRRFPTGFDPGDALETDAAAMRRPRGAFVLGFIDDFDQPVGCGGVQRHEETIGEIKRMWVDPARRGLGIGRMLLDRIEDEARALGHVRVVLDTNSTLTEAIALYERSGYAAVERYNDNPYALCWFAKDLMAGGHDGSS